MAWIVSYTLSCELAAEIKLVASPGVLHSGVRLRTDSNSIMMKVHGSQFCRSDYIIVACVVVALQGRWGGIDDVKIGYS